MDEFLISPKFELFLKEQQIDPNLYKKTLSQRFLRLHPSLLSDSNSKQDQSKGDPFQTLEPQFLCQDLKTTEVQLIPNSFGFFKVPSDTSLSKSPLYQNGKLYGIDISSGSAVLSLDVQPNHQVLDLCCAPGAKLCMIADILSFKESSCSESKLAPGTVTGVDIAKHRLATCRSLIKKYKVAHKTRLVHDDASEFNFLPPTDFRFNHNSKNSRVKEPENSSDLTVKSPGSSKTSIFFSPQHLRANGIEWDSISDPQCWSGYDRVLVDAECTHDGSIAHVLKYVPKENPSSETTPTSESEPSKTKPFTFDTDTFDKTVLGSTKLKEISELQLRLLQQGYRLLKPDGLLVYSTCSFTLEQNELVIARFLNSRYNSGVTPPFAEAIDSLPETIPVANSKPLSSEHLIKLEIPTKYHDKIRDNLKHAVRYDPITSATSGLFLIRLRKPKPSN